MGLLISKRDNIKNSKSTKKHPEYLARISAYHQFLFSGHYLIHKHHKPKHRNRHSTDPRLYEDENCENIYL